MNYKDIQLTRVQWDVLSKILKGKHRYHVLNWARRSGKNFLAMVALIQVALKKPGTRSLFIGKNNESARVTAYQVIVEMLTDQFGKEFFKSNGQTLEITLNNKSVIKCGSSERPDSFRGQELDGLVVCDELDFWGAASGSNFEEMFESVLRPATSRTQAPFLLTSTPRGVGMPLHKWWLKGEADPDQYYLSHVTAYDAEIIPKEEVDAARTDMSPNAFAEEYLAEFVSASSKVYPHFGAHNVSADVEDLGIELHVGLDHNVGQSTAIIGQIAGNNMEIIDEIVLKNSNTREMAISIKAKYPNRNITVYPDPSGRARKTSADIGVTDHTILESEGLKVVTPNKAPLVVDRLNVVNNMIYAADGTRRLFVNPRCTTLIQAMSFHLYDEKKGAPMKGGADRYDDTNDSLGYKLWSLFGRELTGQGRAQTIKSTGFYG